MVYFKKISLLHFKQQLTADNAQKFQFAYDSESGKYGYKAKVEGADTFFPFSGLELHYVVVNTTYNNWSKQIETPSKVKFMYACTLGNGTPIGYLYSDGSYIEPVTINSQMGVDITDTYFKVKFYQYNQYMKAFNFKIVYAT